MQVSGQVSQILINDIKTTVTDSMIWDGEFFTFELKSPPDEVMDKIRKFWIDQDIISINLNMFFDDTKISDTFKIVDFDEDERFNPLLGTPHITVKTQKVYKSQ